MPPRPQISWQPTFPPPRVTAGTTGARAGPTQAQRPDATQSGGLPANTTRGALPLHRAPAGARAGPPDATGATPEAAGAAAGQGPQTAQAVRASSAPARKVDIKPFLQGSAEGFCARKGPSYKNPPRGRGDVPSGVSLGCTAEPVGHTDAQASLLPAQVTADHRASLCLAGGPLPRAVRGPPSPRLPFPCWWPSACLTSKPVSVFLSYLSFWCHFHRYKRHHMVFAFLCLTFFT